MSRKTAIAVAASIVLSLSSHSQAQSTLTLDEAIGRALAKNPAIAAARAAESEARERVPQARAGYLPRLDLVEAWHRSNEPVFVFGSLLSQRQFTAENFAIDALNHPDAQSNHHAGVLMEQVIFDGSTRHGVTAASLDARAAGAAVERAAANLRLDVTRAYGRALAALARADSSRAELAAATEDLRRVQTRRDAGLETEASVLSLQVRADEADAGLATARSEVAISRAALNALMGAPLDDAMPLASVTPAEWQAVDQASLEQAAVNQRPELRESTIRRERAEVGRSLARAGFLPRVVFQGIAEANGETFATRATAWGVGFEARWNLFAGGADAARMKEAASAIVRASAEREGLETAIRLEVRTAVAEYEAAAARERTGRRMVEQARESQRIIRDRYDAGLASAADLLRASETVARAEQTRISTSVDVQVALAALARATGVPGMTP